MGNEITKTEPIQMQISTDASPMIQIAQMKQAGLKIDPAEMREFMTMHREYQADEARKAYASAFAAAQADIGGVVKTRKNKQTNSMYAGLDDVIEMSKTVCATHSFSVTFSEGVTEVEEHIRICATVLHKDGHREAYHYDVPLGGKGIKGVVNMTAIHAKATSVSYGQRYLLCMIWNIPTKDTDGNIPNATPTAQKIVPPNEKETETLRLICNAIPPKDGFAVSLVKVGLICHTAYQEYPRNSKTVSQIAEWITTSFNDSQVYDVIQPTNEQPGKFA